MDNSESAAPEVTPTVDEEYIELGEISQDTHGSWGLVTDGGIGHFTF